MLWCWWRTDDRRQTRKRKMQDARHKTMVLLRIAEGCLMRDGDHENSNDLGFHEAGLINMTGDGDERHATGVGCKPRPNAVSVPVHDRQPSWWIMDNGKWPWLFDIEHAGRGRQDFPVSTLAYLRIYQESHARDGERRPTRVRPCHRGGNLGRVGKGGKQNEKEKQKAKDRITRPMVPWSSSRRHLDSDSRLHLGFFSLLSFDFADGSQAI